MGTDVIHCQERRRRAKRSLWERSRAGASPEPVCGDPSPSGVTAWSNDPVHLRPKADRTRCSSDRPCGWSWRSATSASWPVRPGWLTVPTPTRTWRRPTRTKSSPRPQRWGTPRRSKRARRCTSCNKIGTRHRHKHQEWQGSQQGRSTDLSPG